MASSKTSDFGRMLTVKEAAPIAGVSSDYLRDLCLRGEIQSVKIGTRPGKRGGRRLIPESEVQNWIARNLRAA